MKYSNFFSFKYIPSMCKQKDFWPIFLLFPIWSCRRWNQWRRRSGYRCRCSDSFFVSLQLFRWASSTVLFLLRPEDTSTPLWWVVFFHTYRSDSVRIFTFWCLCFWVMLLWLSIGLIVGSSLSSLLLVTLLDGTYFLSLKLGFILKIWFDLISISFWIVFLY